MHHRRIRSGGTFRNITLLLQNQNPQISFAQSVSDKGTAYPCSDYRYICHQSYYKIEIEMKNIRLIIIDMDGTLYDMADLIADGFDTADDPVFPLPFHRYLSLGFLPQRTFRLSADREGKSHD